MTATLLQATAVKMGRIVRMRKQRGRRPRKPKWWRRKKKGNHVKRWGCSWNREDIWEKRHIEKKTRFKQSVFWTPVLLQTDVQRILTYVNAQVYLSVFPPFLQFEKKKQKDTGGPKRPMSAYMLWLNSSRERIKSENPGISITEISKKAGEMWRQLGKDEKEVRGDFALPE